MDGEGLVPKELMPLPMVEMSVDDMKDLYASHAQAKFGEFGTQWQGARREVTSRMRGAVSWVTVMVAALNFMHAGANTNPRIPILSAGPASSVQMEVIHRLYLDADDLMGENREKFRSREWEGEMNNLRMDYDGVSVAKAMDLTLE